MSLIKCLVNVDILTDYPSLTEVSLITDTECSSLPRPRPSFGICSPTGPCRRAVSSQRASSLVDSVLSLRLADSGGVIRQRATPLVDDSSRTNNVKAKAHTQREREGDREAEQPISLSQQQRKLRRKKRRNDSQLSVTVSEERERERNSILTRERRLREVQHLPHLGQSLHTSELPSRRQTLSK